MRFLPRPIDIVNRSVGVAGLTVKLDISYGPANRGKLDIYRPADAKKRPVIVFFYGGSWQWGHRRDYQFMAALLGRRGFVVAVPDYRLYPDVKFPLFLDDCAAATAFMLAHASEFGGLADEIFLVGHSAGAYNALMIGLNPAFLEGHGQQPGALAGLVGLSGPYDFLPLRDPDIKAIFSVDGDMRVTQPISYASEAAPPIFLAHGGADTTVLPRNTTALAARLRQHGNMVETKIYPKLGHVGMILSNLPYLAWRAPVLNDMLAFISNCRADRQANSGSELQVPVIG